MSCVLPSCEEGGLNCGIFHAVIELKEPMIEDVWPQIWCMHLINLDLVEEVGCLKISATTGWLLRFSHHGCSCKPQ